MKTLSFIRCVLFLLLFNSLFAQVSPFQTADGWVWKNPLPFGGNFNYSTVLSDDVSLITGDYGVVIRSENGEDSWSQCSVPDDVTSPISKMQFFDDKSSGYAVVGERLLRTSNGGVT